MKKSTALYIVILLVLNACRKDNGADDSGLIPDFQPELQNLVDEKWTEFVDGRSDIPGGYALKLLTPKGNYFLHSEGMGNITDKTHFRAASVTKTFTAAAIVLLHQQQKLSIYDVVTDLIPGTTEPYLPETSEFDIPYKNEITIQQLLQHRAGVYDIINQNIPDSVNQPYAGMRYVDYVEEDLGEPYHTFTITEMANVVSVNQLYNNIPDANFHYSNTGMTLLTLIVERITGSRFDVFVKDNFLSPLGLNNTSMPHLGDDITIPSPFAEGFAYIDGETVDVTEDNVSMSIGEGNLITTPEDLSTWISKLYSGNAGVDYKFVRFLMMDCLPTYELHQHYGLGTTYTPGLGYGHNGGKLGFFTSTRHDPVTGITYVIYTNIWDFDAFAFNVFTQLTNMYGVAYAATDIVKK